MQFKMTHNSINVLDLEKSMKFYEEAFGLKEVRRIAPESGNFILVFLANENAEHRLELTWVKGRTKPYNLGDNEFHLGFVTPDFDEAYKKHKEMGIICFENPKMGLYFVTDPDGYWLEIVPVR
jgi:lactoylglutathione lyase